MAQQRTSAERPPCGVLFTNEGLPPIDVTGCQLPSGHGGPHEFVARNGARYQWETDWDCTCESCLSADGDYCSIYWQKDPSAT